MKTLFLQEYKEYKAVEIKISLTYKNHYQVPQSKSMRRIVIFF